MTTMKKQILSEEFKRMQELAGIIIEGADLYPVASDPETKSLYDKIANSLSPEELKMIAPNTPIIVTG
jgi:hypothetical protein